MNFTFICIQTVQNSHLILINNILKVSCYSTVFVRNQSTKRYIGFILLYLLYLPMLHNQSVRENLSTQWGSQIKTSLHWSMTYSEYSKFTNTRTYLVTNSFSEVVNFLIQKLKQSWREELKVLNYRLFWWSGCLEIILFILFISFKGEGNNTDLKGLIIFIRRLNQQYISKQNQ